MRNLATQANKQDIMAVDLQKWKRWRWQQDEERLGYPTHTVEQTIPGTQSTGTPDWSAEIRIDNAVLKEMPKPYGRVILAAFDIPLRLQELESMGIYIAFMRHPVESENRYYWPKLMEQSYKAIGLSRPTYYPLLKTAKAWLEGRYYF